MTHIRPRRRFQLRKTARELVARIAGCSGSNDSLISLISYVGLSEQHSCKNAPQNNINPNPNTIG